MGDSRAGAVIRVSDADRQDTVDRLDVARHEGRLDDQEHGLRVRTARAARFPAELATLVADLPRRPGTYAWEGRLRVRAADRARATGWLDDARAEGRLSAAEHDRRLGQVSGALTYAAMKKPLDGVPGPPGVTRGQLFIATADREWLTARLARALEADRIGTADHDNMRGAVVVAQRYADLDRVAEALARHLRGDPRAEVVRRLDEALADGRLGPAEHDRRVAAARQATRNAVLRRQLRDIPEARGITPEWIVGRTGAVLTGRAATDAVRGQVLHVLARARQEGRLDLGEHDERVAAAHAAADLAGLRPLLADLILPSPSSSSESLWPELPAEEPPPDDPLPAEAPAPKRRGRLAAALAEWRDRWD